MQSMYLESMGNDVNVKRWYNNRLAGGLANGCRAMYKLSALVCLSGMIAGSADAQPVVALQGDSEWAKLPDGRQWGAVSGVHADPDGEHIWVLDRCGRNSCVSSDIDPVLKFDLAGNLVASFGGGLFGWPHGLFVDHEGYVWVADAGTGQRGEEAASQGLGHRVLKLGPQDGEVLLELGTAGVSGRGEDTFNGPSAVLVADNGDVFVADGHDTDGNNRIVRFSQDGVYLTEWGVTGPGPAAGEMRDPHTIAMDSQDRLYVGDRGNSRIQIFTPDGVYLDSWGQFGPASQIFIDASDVLYVTDAPSAAAGPTGSDRTEGWQRGIRIGDAGTGQVTGFLSSEAEFVTVDQYGTIYGAEVQGRALLRYR